MKIADFGLSAILCSTKAMEVLASNDEVQRMVTMHEAVGSKLYAAPEVLLGLDYDKSVDLWGLGVCVYIMLSGRMPFATVDEVCAADVIFDDPCWDLISPFAKDLVTRLLVRDPRARLGTADVMSHPWLSGMAPDRDLGLSGGGACLKQYQDLRSFQRVCLTVMLSEMKASKELAHIQAVFEEADRSGDGCLTQEELEIALRTRDAVHHADAASSKDLALSVGAAEGGAPGGKGGAPAAGAAGGAAANKKKSKPPRKLFSVGRSGKKKEGAIDLETFSMMYLARHRSMVQDYVRATFDRLDVCKDGRLHHDEVKSAFSKWVGQTLSDDEVDAVITSMSNDKEGHEGLDYHDFVTGLADLVNRAEHTTMIGATGRADHVLKLL